MEGSVKWFSDKKGYGFLTTTDGKEVFVHYSAICGKGFRTLKEGSNVTFDVEPGEKGLKAINVKVEDSAPVPTEAPTETTTEATN